MCVCVSYYIEVYTSLCMDVYIELYMCVGVFVCVRVCVYAYIIHK